MGIKSATYFHQKDAKIALNLVPFFLLNSWQIAKLKGAIPAERIQNCDAKLTPRCQKGPGTKMHKCLFGVLIA